MPYNSLEKIKEHGKIYYLKNRARLIAKAKRYSKEHPAQIKKVHRARYMAKREEIIMKSTLAMEEWRKNNPIISTEQNTLRWRKMRREILEFLGGAICVKCGFDDWRALQIDHVHGGGLKEIRSFTSIRKYYDQIMANKSNYQVLCANCNRIKVHENKEWRKNKYAKTK